MPPSLANTVRIDRPEGVVATVSDRAPELEPIPHAVRELVVVNRFALRSHSGFISKLRSHLSDALFAEPDVALAHLERPRAQLFERITISGGDGTLNRFLSPLLSAGLPVRLVPSGTANDLAHELGIAEGLPDEEVDADRLAIREIDVLTAEGRPFTTVGYLGFGSDVVRQVNGWRKLGWFQPLVGLLGRFVYVLGVLEIALSRALPLYRLKIESQGRTLEIESPLVVAANQARVGATMNLARGTRNDDGTFRVLVFRQKGGLALLRAIAALTAGAEPASAGVESFETCRAEIVSTDSRQFLFCADGEELVETQRLTLAVHPRKLKVLV